MSEKVKQIVTDSIIQSLRTGVAPWRKPWILARNGKSGRAYTGTNAVLLSHLYDNPNFFSYKQAQALGARVRKGEHGNLAVFFSGVSETETDGEKKQRAFMRFYRVWNATQCDGLPEKFLQSPASLTDSQAAHAAQTIVDGFFARDGAPRRMPGTGRALYSPTDDVILLPSKAGFVSEADYYCTAFHEMAHATGAAKRLSRTGFAEYVKNQSVRALEELTAEICAAMLACHAGIVPAAPENTAAYCESWLAALENDRGMILKAASAAQKAFDLIVQGAVQEDTEVRATGTDGAGDVAATIEAPKKRTQKARASEYVDLL